VSASRAAQEEFGGRDIGRRPVWGFPNLALALDEEPHFGPVHHAVGEALEMVIIPGQQFGSMEVGLAKEGLSSRFGPFTSR
jgi:hypothetical protein